jgi:pimeloyl-ACP methyl ester carboxylesterase
VCADRRTDPELTQVRFQVGLGYSPASTARLLSGIATTAGAGVGYWLLRGRRARANLDWTPPSGRAHSGTLHARIVDGEGDGEGDVVVLLHGLGASNLYWGAKYDQLACGGLLVAPDLLGFGSSPRPHVHYTPDDHADAVAATLSEVGVNRPAIVVAHSIGCLVALRLAARHPDRVGGVVGFGPPLYPDAGTARERLTRLGLISRLFATDTWVAERLCTWMCCTRPAVAARLTELLRPGLPTAVARDGVRHSWASYHGTLRRVLLAADAASWLPAVSPQVHFVAGGRDRVVDLDHLRELSAAHRQLSVTVWPEAHHDEPLVNPDAFVREIRMFRKRTSVGGRAGSRG